MEEKYLNTTYSTFLPPASLPNSQISPGQFSESSSSSSNFLDISQTRATSLSQHAYINKHITPTPPVQYHNGISVLPKATAPTSPVDSEINFLHTETSGY